MQKLTLALALLFSTSFLISEECEMVAEAIEQVQEFEVFQEEPAELKELIGAMKTDRMINKDRVNRLKKIIREKGYSKQVQNKSDSLNVESTEEA